MWGLRVWCRARLDERPCCVVEGRAEVIEHIPDHHAYVPGKLRGALDAEEDGALGCIELCSKLQLVGAVLGEEGSVELFPQRGESLLRPGRLSVRTAQPAPRLQSTRGHHPQILCLVKQGPSASADSEPSEPCVEFVHDHSRIPQHLDLLSHPPQQVITRLAVDIHR